MTIRFHLDENMPSAVAAGLRLRGLDVTTTPEAELRTASDPLQLDHASAEGRVIVTRDRDFLFMASSQPSSTSRIGRCPGPRTRSTNTSFSITVKSAR